MKHTSYSGPCLLALVLAAPATAQLASGGNATDLPALTAPPAQRDTISNTDLERRALGYSELFNYYRHYFGTIDEPSTATLGSNDVLGYDPFADPALGLRMLAKAQPDECYSGIGGGVPGLPPCAPGSQEKVNQAYVWGLTKFDDKLYFGTAPNVHCLVMGSFLGQVGPVETNSYVCEFGQSPVVMANPLWPEALGDWRPSDLFCYDLGDPNPATALTEITGELDGPATVALIQTIGIRSAGSHDGVVFFAGPQIGLSASLNMFAFDAYTGAFLGHRNFAEYGNIRKWRVIGDELYCGVGNSLSNPFPGGSVLRWTGDASDPFQFEIVGRVDTEVAELVGHMDRIVVTTWPQLGASGLPVGLAGVFMSPLFGPDGRLGAADANGWARLWRADDYEVDPVVAATYGGGAVASFGEWVVWGTMHVPGLSTFAHSVVYGPSPNPLAAAIRALGTYRAISIHRARPNPAHPGGWEVEVLYGMPKLPAYSPITGWRLEDNNTGFPRWGFAGMDNLFNNYTWTMEVFQDRLYVGTMDWSYLLADGLLSLINVPTEFAFLGYRDFGADLWCFPHPTAPAEIIYRDGLTQPLNYGIRTMVACPDSLYCGTANPMNLLPGGGWELRELFDLVGPCPEDVDGDGAIDDDDWFFVFLRIGDSGEPGTVPGDVDADGVVTFTDLGLVFDALGTTCEA